MPPGPLEDWDAPPTHHGYKGGNLYGVIEHLDWLTDLGINAIYFNPIFQSASNHRYHTHDYFTVDPLLGGDAAFDEMLTACHDRGIRVVLDGVLNHASRGFFPFSDIMESGADSPYVDWFDVHDYPVRAYHTDEPNYAAWWGLPALPKLNTDNPHVREYLMRVSEHWMERGADGWRLDVPEEISTPGFWEEFRTRVRAANPEAYIVGEIWEPAADWVNAGTRFDGVMNYQLTNGIISFAAGDRVVHDVIKDENYRVTPARDAGQFADHLDWLGRIYPARTALGNLNLLGSHDTPRVHSVVGGDDDSVILATMLLMTLPGAPCVYYGDEVGLDGLRDPDCRRGFPWDHPDIWRTSILEATRSLISLRKQHSALRTGTYERLWPVPTVYKKHLLVYRRTDAHGSVLVAINAGESEEVAQIDGSGTLVWGQGDLGEGRLTVPARSGAMWTT